MSSIAAPSVNENTADSNDEAAASASQGGSNNRRIGSRVRLDRMKQGISKVGNALQKINLAKLIDEMEQDQELADHLEVINQDIKEEEARKELVREATAACQAEIESHLDEFLRQHPDGQYEEWIQEAHPENVAEGNIFEDLKEVDMRFYVQDSDHRLLWNSRVGDATPERLVPARSYKHRLSDDHPTDLLDEAGHQQQQQQSASPELISHPSQQNTALETATGSVVPDHNDTPDHNDMRATDAPDSREATVNGAATTKNIDFSAPGGLDHQGNSFFDAMG